MTITIPPQLESRLKDQASRRGVEPDDFARQLIENGLPLCAENNASIEVLKRWEQENATTDPAEIARRNEEFEAFKDAMNRNRLESEGPNARKVFP